MLSLSSTRLATALLSRSLTRHLSTKIQPSRQLSSSFFSQRPLLRPQAPTIPHSPLRRSFSSASGYKTRSAYESSRTVILTFLALNTAVFGAWQYAKTDTNTLRWMHRHFTLNARNIREGRYYTMLTSAISQYDLSHFAFNMITFYTFGNILSYAGIGGAPIAALCLGSALAGSVSMYYQDLRGPFPTSGLGASGVVMGMGAAATCLMPFAPMQIMFIPVNIPLWVITLAYFGLDAYYLRDARSMVGHSAHLGGSFFGLAFYAVVLRRFGGIAQMFRRR